MLLDEVGTYLQDLGFGTLGTDMFLGEMPVNPISCIALFEFPGSVPAYIHDIEGFAHEFPELRIFTRAKSGISARVRIENITRVLGQVHNTFLGDTFYLRVSPASSPYKMAVDENTNSLFACRFHVIKTPSPLT